MGLYMRDSNCITQQRKDYIHIKTHTRKHCSAFLALSHS